MDSVLSSNVSVRTSAREWLSIGQHEEVLNSEEMYWTIDKDFKNCKMKTVHIHRILHSESPHILDSFNKQKAILQRKNSSIGCNELDLYCGCDPNSVIIYCQEGLDQRSEKKNKYRYFGNGIYFSESPGRCRIEAESVPSSSHYILRCKVILGDCKKYKLNEQDPDLLREPVKSQNSVTGTMDYYDSVMGRPAGEYREYVVYEKRHVLVEYVIEYTCDQPLPILPPVKKTTASGRQRRRAHSAGSDTSNNSYGEDISPLSDNDSDNSHGDNYESTPESANQSNPLAEVVISTDTIHIEQQPHASNITNEATGNDLSTLEISSRTNRATSSAEEDYCDDVMKVFSDLVTEFVSFTCADRKLAAKYLIKHRFKLDTAVDDYYNPAS